MCSDPDTVGGGVSMEKTCSRLAAALKREVPSSSQTAAHLASTPSRVGLSGTWGAAVAVVDMIGLPYPDAAPARHRNRHRPPFRVADPGRSVDVCLWANRLRPAPHRPRPLHPDVRRAAPLRALQWSGRARLEERRVGKERRN